MWSDLRMSTSRTAARGTRVGGGGGVGRWGLRVEAGPWLEGQVVGGPVGSQSEELDHGPQPDSGGRAVAELLLLTRAGCFQGNQPESLPRMGFGWCSCGVRPGKDRHAWGGCVQDADSWMSSTLVWSTVLLNFLSNTVTVLCGWQEELILTSFF